MSKADRTRERILEAGIRMASSAGFNGVSLAPLADEVALSKSGLFAHFASKEALQLAMLDFAAERFRETVVVPTLRVRRGLSRLRASFEFSLNWAERAKLPGGCLFYAAAAELDDQPGRVREELVALQARWFASLRRILDGAVECGELPADVDRAQLISEYWGILMMHRFAGRLMHDRLATRRARASFERLVASARRAQRSRV